MELIRRIRDWVFTVPTLVAFGAVMVITDPILRLVRFFGDRPMSVVAQWAQATLLPVFKLSGAKVSVEQMIHLGHDTEATALSHAVRLHCEERVQLNGQRTVIL